MKNFFQLLLSSPKLLGLTAFASAFLALMVTFGLVNNESDFVQNTQLSNRIFIVGPGNTQSSIANSFYKPQQPIIETAVTVAKEGLEKKTKTYFQRIAEDFVQGFTDGYKRK